MPSPVMSPGWLLLMAGSLLLLLVCMVLFSRLSASTETCRTVHMPQNVLNQAAPALIPDLIWTPDPCYRQTMLTKPDEPPPDVEASSPVCLQTGEQDVLCIGRVWNHHLIPLNRARITLTLPRFMQEKTVPLAYQTIFPGESAPYHTHFDLSLRDDLAAIADQPVYTRVDYANDTGQPVKRLTVTTLDQVRESPVNGVGYGTYRLMAQLQHTGTEMLHDVRVVVTLLDEDEQIAGYRLWQVSDFMPGERREMALTLIPVVTDRHLTHTIIAEGCQMC